MITTISRIEVTIIFERFGYSHLTEVTLTKMEHFLTALLTYPEAITLLSADPHRISNFLDFATLSTDHLKDGIDGDNLFQALMYLYGIGSVELFSAFKGKIKFPSLIRIKDDGVFICISPGEIFYMGYNSAVVGESSIGDFQLIRMTSEQLSDRLVNSHREGIKIIQARIFPVDADYLYQKFDHALEKILGHIHLHPTSIAQALPITEIDGIQRHDFTSIDNQEIRELFAQYDLPKYTAENPGYHNHPNGFIMVRGCLQIFMETRMKMLKTKMKNLK